jgi:uncharacterized delta-60 repeat protein
MYENSSFDPLDPKIFMVDNLRTFVSQPPVLDPTFSPSSGNIVPLTFVAEQALQESDGQILTVGHQGSTADGNSQGVLEQLNSDGSTDTTFGSGGMVTTDASAEDTFQSAAIQSNGQIVAVGATNDSFLVARYNSDGSLDTNFGSGGFTMVGFGAGVSAIASTVAIDANGNIVVGGEAGTDFALARLTSSGALDASFNPAGRDDPAFPNGGQLTIATGGNGAVQQILIDGAGRILGVGASGAGIAVFQLDPDGTDDHSFGSSSIEVINQLSSADPNSQSAITEGIALQPDGDILVAGESPTGGLAAARLTPSGKFDPTFGVHGLSVASFGGSDDDATGIGADPANGQFLLVGTTNVGGTEQIAVAAFNSDGTVNTTFASDGQFVLPAPGVLGSESVTADSLTPRPLQIHPQLTDFVFATIGADEKPLVGASGAGTASLTRLNPVSPGSSFGRKGHKNLLAFTLADGTNVTITAVGGSGTAYQSGNQVEVNLAGDVSVTIHTQGGSNSLSLSSVTSTGILRSLDAPTATLAGTLADSGTIGILKLANITGIVIAGGISSLSAGSLSGSVSCSGILATAKLGMVDGTIAASTIRSLNAESINGATILAGANLGSDGEIGGSSSATDTYNAGEIFSINVSGSIARSFIGAGVNPVDGVFGDGDDASAGPGGIIRSISVKKGIDAITRFEGSAFPKIVHMPAKTPTATDPQFIVLH